MDKTTEELSLLESQYKNLSRSQFAEKATDIAVRQIMACSDFKRPRLTTTDKYYRLYDGKVAKKLRQLFNVPIPVFAGMIDTLNAQYDTGIFLEFEAGDASDYFKTEKLNGAWRNEVMNASHTSKWDSKLRQGRKHMIMTGRMILEYQAGSKPEYYSELSNVLLKDFNFQPRGGLHLENHYFAGTEDIERTESDLIQGAKHGIYDMEQVKSLLRSASRSEYLTESEKDMQQKLARFQPLGLDPEANSYVGQTIFKFAQQIIEIDGSRYYVMFHPWTKVWIRFEKWIDIDSSDLYPWVTAASHEDDENFLSKSYADDIYAASDAIVAMFNQELTNREKRNFGARAYDKDMFKDVRKLDESMHRPDALVPADTQNGTKRISEGVYEFKVGELGGTVNLIDWITGSLGRNTGATDLSMGGVQEVSKKASVTFAEQKAVSKRIGWGAQPMQDMMADLGTRFIWGLKNHMPARMAIKVLGESGYDWDEITRMDLDTKKEVNILIRSNDDQKNDSALKAERRAKALGMVDPNVVNPHWRNEQILRTIGDFEDEEIAQAQDMKTYHDRKSLSKASEMIQAILRNEKPPLWGGATTSFMQKIVDFASDKRFKLKEKYKILIDYALAHKDIVIANIDRQIIEQALAREQASASMTPEGGAIQGTSNVLPVTNLTKPAQPPAPTAQHAGMSGGMSRAMTMGEQMV